MTTSQRVFRQRIRRLIVVPLVISLLIVGVLEIQVWRLTSAQNWVDHTDVVLSQARLLLRALVDQETGLRGYLLTHDERFLQPYHSSGAMLDGLFSGTRRLIADNPAQQKEFDDIRQSYTRWHEYAEDTIAKVRANDPAITTVAFNLHGKELMDDVRQQQQEFVDGEERLKDIRMKRSQDVGRTLGWTLLGLVFVFVGTIVNETRSGLRFINAEYASTLDNLENRTRELSESRERLHVTLQSIGDAVIVTDAKGKVTFLNPVAERLLQRTQQSVAGKPLSEIFKIVNEETRLPVESPFTKVMRLGTIVGLANHTVLLRDDGSEISIDDSGAPIRDGSGNIFGVVLVFRDVTEQKGILNTLRTNEKLAAAGKLSASIAHEIHNPLETVRNLFYLMRKRATPELEKLILTAEQELSRVVQITKNMLSLYRESKRATSVKLTEVVDSVADLMQRSFRDKDIQFSKQFLTESPISAFPAEMRQVVSNLIANSIDAVSPGGRIEVRVEDATLEDSHPGVALVVRDNGTGVSKQDQAHLFLPFFTTKGENGTGLGLWIVQGIVSKHGGYIDVSSEVSGENRGTTFTITFPRADAKPVKATQTEEIAS